MIKEAVLQKISGNPEEKSEEEKGDLKIINGGK